MSEKSLAEEIAQISHPNDPDFVRRAEENWNRNQAEEILNRTMRELEEKLSRAAIPSPFVYSGNIWLATGCWEVARWEVNRRALNLRLMHIWASSDGEFATFATFNDSLPEGFSPKFSLLRKLEVGITLLPAHTTSNHWVTEADGQVKEEVLAILKEEAPKRLAASPYLKMLKT